MIYHFRGVPRAQRADFGAVIQNFEAVIQAVIQAHWEAYQRLLPLCPDGGRVDLPSHEWYISRFGSAILIEDSSGWWMVLDSPEKRALKSESQTAFRAFGQADAIEAPPKDGLPPDFWEKAHVACGRWQCDVFFDCTRDAGGPEWFSHTIHKLDFYHGFIDIYERLLGRLGEVTDG